MVRVIVLVEMASGYVRHVRVQKCRCVATVEEPESLYVIARLRVVSISEHKHTSSEIRLLRRNNCSKPMVILSIMLKLMRHYILKRLQKGYRWMSGKPLLNL